MRVRAGDERGQASWMMLLFFPLLIGLMWVGLDAATYLMAREGAQRAADAAALAAALDLPCNGSLFTTNNKGLNDAKTYGGYNGFTIADSDVSCPPVDGPRRNNNAFVEVYAQKTIGFLSFGPLSQTVRARAVASPGSSQFPYVLMAFADNCKEFGIELKSNSHINVLGRGGIYAHGCGGNEAIGVDAGSTVTDTTLGSRIDVAGPVLCGGSVVPPASFTPCSTLAGHTSSPAPVTIAALTDPITGVVPPKLDATKYTPSPLSLTVPTLPSTVSSLSPCAAWSDPIPVDHHLAPGCYAAIDTSTGPDWTMSPVYPAAAPTIDNGSCTTAVSVGATVTCTGTTSVRTIPGGTLVLAVTGASGQSVQILGGGGAPTTLGTCPRSSALPTGTVAAPAAATATFTCAAGQSVPPLTTYTLSVKTTVATGKPTVTATDNANSPPAAAGSYGIQNGIKVSPTSSLTMSSGSAFSLAVSGTVGGGDLNGIDVLAGGVFTMQPGTYNIPNNTNVSGTLNMNSSGGSYLMQDDFTVTGTGAMNLQPGTYTFTSTGSLSVAGTLTMASGGAYSVYMAGNLTVSGGGSATLQPGTYNIPATTVAGTLNMNSSGGAYLMQDDFTITSTGAMNLQPAEYRFTSNGSVSVAGTLTLAPGAAYTVQWGGLTLTGGSATLQPGTYNLLKGTCGCIAVSGGTLTMNPGAYSVDVQGSGTCPGGTSVGICVSSGATFNMSPGYYNVASGITVQGTLLMSTGSNSSVYTAANGITVMTGGNMTLSPGVYNLDSSGIEVCGTVASTNCNGNVSGLTTGGTLTLTECAGCAPPQCAGCSLLGSYVVAVPASNSSAGITLDAGSGTCTSGFDSTQGQPVTGAGTCTHPGGTLKGTGVLIYMTCSTYTQALPEACGGTVPPVGGGSKVGGASAPTAVMSTAQGSLWEMTGDPDFGGIVYWVDRTMNEESHTILGGGVQTLGCTDSASLGSLRGYCPTNQDAPAILYTISTEIQHGDSGSPACTACDVFNLYGQVVSFDFDLLAGQTYNVTFDSPFTPPAPGGGGVALSE